MLNMKKNRNNQIDIIKGIAIILIVLGHTYSPASHFVYLFHVSIFIVVSGFLWDPNDSKDWNSYFLFVKKKIKRLYFPYIFANIVGILLNNILLNIGWYTSINHTYFSFYDTAFNIFKVLVFHNDTEIFGASWFLRLLFFISIFYGLFEVIAKNINKTKKNIIRIIISIIMLLIGFALCRIDANLKIIDIAFFTCFIFFSFGRKIRILNLAGSILKKFLIFIFTLSMLLIFNKNGTIEISKNIYTNVFFFLTVSFCGWFFLYELSFFIEKIIPLKKMLIYIGQNTMPILLLHFIVFKVVSMFLSMTFSETLSFEMYKNGFWWLFYTLAGVFIPLIINQFLRRFK